MKQWIAECVNGHSPKSITFRIMRQNDGEIRYINGLGELVVDKEGKPLYMTGTAQDVTESKVLEEQFLQAQKMESLGTLVGGIAHDFNNMLAGLNGNIYMAKKSVGDPEGRRHLDNAEHLLFHAADLISQLLTYARKDRVSMQSLPLIPFIKELLKLLRSTIPESIHLLEFISQDSLMVKADVTQLQQVILNLVNNARDAVDGVDHPQVTISLESLISDDKFRHKHPEAVYASYAHMTVADNGCGIPEDKLEHIFDPFFTTKEVGKGTGLGLSMVFGAVHTHQGFIFVESVEGKGSKFHIYLPLEEVKNTALGGVEKENLALEGKGELILLVDDDYSIIEIGKEVIESLGYSVLVASSGHQAIDVFGAHKDEVDLVITDVVMPDLGGVQVMEEIRKINPNIKVLFSTGYDMKSNLENSVVPRDVEILTKPYRVETLKEILRSQLEK